MSIALLHLSPPNPSHHLAAAAFAALEPVVGVEVHRLGMGSELEEQVSLSFFGLWTP